MLYIKKLMNKFIFLIIVSLLLSCKRKSEVENIFISEQNEYWNYKDCDEGHSLYFRFYEKGDYDTYLSKPMNESKGFDLFNDDGDLVSGLRTWSIKNDSTFVWDESEYKIEICTKDSIILTYFHYKEKDKKCKVTFRKVLDK